MSEMKGEDVARPKVRLRKMKPGVPALRQRKMDHVGVRISFRELVDVFLPGVDDVTADYLLWERTCFPMGSLGDVARQLQQAIVNGHVAVDLRHFERELRATS